MHTEICFFTSAVFNLTLYHFITMLVVCRKSLHPSGVILLGKCLLVTTKSSLAGNEVLYVNVRPWTRKSERSTTNIWQCHCFTQWKESSVRFLEIYLVALPIGNAYTSVVMTRTEIQHWLILELDTMDKLVTIVRHCHAHCKHPSDMNIQVKIFANVYGFTRRNLLSSRKQPTRSILVNVLSLCEMNFCFTYLFVHFVFFPQECL